MVFLTVRIFFSGSVISLGALFCLRIPPTFQIFCRDCYSDFLQVVQAGKNFFVKSFKILSANQLIRIVQKGCSYMGNLIRKGPEKDGELLPQTYVSVNSMPDHPPLPGDPRGFARYHCPGGRVLAQLSLPGESGFSIREIFYSSSRKMQELLNLIQRDRRQFEKQVFLCCFISIFAKTADVYYIFGDIDRFLSFR